MIIIYTTCLSKSLSFLQAMKLKLTLKNNFMPLTFWINCSIYKHAPYYYIQKITGVILSIRSYLNSENKNLMRCCTGFLWSIYRSICISFYNCIQNEYTIFLFNSSKKRFCELYVYKQFFPIIINWLMVSKSL